MSRVMLGIVRERNWFLGWWGQSKIAIGIPSFTPVLLSVPPPQQRQLETGTGDYGPGDHD